MNYSNNDSGTTTGSYQENFICKYTEEIRELNVVFSAAEKK